ncbi:hypothetical protein [Flavobacterium sp. LHD-85]|uniref:hypothetical protein n=1 Tax=Flavobacterium sp. LHD-85 TaxID=3071410 RepID=UPI0027DFB1E5|nr:hypothetical protein [Flavobacterium sp. LHD-85]MDQ6528660.1 hypothetical protein [Flavobacterium sp. LHD-85]
MQKRLLTRLRNTGINLVDGFWLMVDGTFQTINQKPSTINLQTMLNKGLRDEEKIRIDNVLKTLRTLVYVPYPLNNLEKENIENQLKEIGLNLETLSSQTNDDLITLLMRLHFDWEHLEKFGDILIEFSKDENYNFTDKTLAIYQYIQKESKVFSFGINTKISSLKNK